jgi:tRNA G18 (ribose-2'-O)-methylase SpoU
MVATMKTTLTAEETRTLQLILEKAKQLEREFVRGKEESPTNRPVFERLLSELIVLFRQLEFSANPLVQRQAELADHLHPGMTPRHLLNFVLPIERLLDRNLRDDDLLVTTADRTDRATAERTEATRAKRSLFLVLDHLRSAFNVGSIYRMAETLNASEILLCGYTPGPESDGVQKTAMGTEGLTPTRRFDRIDGALAFLRERNIKIMALETSPQARSLYDGDIPEACAFVVGNERFGLDYHTLKLCDEIVQIPLVGTKNSLNVASALSVACFEWHRQHLPGTSRRTTT